MEPPCSLTLCAPAHRSAAGADHSRAAVAATSHWICSNHEGEHPAALALSRERRPPPVLQSFVRSFVSRAGQKLDHALDAFAINVPGLTCADFGSNVGG